MTKKDQLAQELKEKVKAGIKPSDLRSKLSSLPSKGDDLKKLKRSKSADDIADIPPAPPLPLVNDQLSEKQKEIELLRKTLEEVNSELKATKEQLDNSLSARVEGIKTFGKEHDKRKQAQKELNETIDEASSELMAGDKQTSKLGTKLLTAQQEISKLKNELKLERIKRGTSLPNSDEPTNLNYLKHALYSLLAIWFTLLLFSKLKKENHA